MNNLLLPCEIGQVSDGYHTFDELYEHRHALLIALMSVTKELSWVSKFHDDGTYLEGWFIAGITLPSGNISYHLPMRLWLRACEAAGSILTKAPKWDGHTSKDVLNRLENWDNR